MRPGLQKIVILRQLSFLYPLLPISAYTLRRLTVAPAESGASSRGRYFMCRIHDLVAGMPVYFADADQNVMEVVRMMVQNNIGAVPVLSNHKLVGIFSERDLMRRVVAKGLDANTTRIDEVMTSNPQVVSPDHELEDCLQLMRDHGFRHLPICHEGTVKGMVSLRDILLRDLVEKDDETRMLRAYIAAGPEV
jgi:CBS domain-containing protein